MEENKKMLCDAGYEDITVFENPSYEGALVGVTSDRRAVYDYGMMVQSLVKNEGMSEEDAEDFIDYNTIRSLRYREDSPIVMYWLKGE